MKCKLCGRQFLDDQMSEEHYPAKSVGNDDIIKFDIIKMMDMFMASDSKDNNSLVFEPGESLDSVLENSFDKCVAKDLFPNGRTNRTLCKQCNTFLGKYDEAYLKFFEVDGNPFKVKGFQRKTKLHIIKSIYGKFLSVPETEDEEFDFIDFIKNEAAEEYQGEWNLYFVKRDFTTDILGFPDIRTGKLEYEEGVVYELSDEKFIFDLMNFQIHSSISMNNIFDILSDKFSLIEGLGEDGGYHAQILMTSLFQDNQDSF